MPPATLGSWLIIGRLILSAKVAGCRLRVATPALHSEKVSQRKKTSDPSAGVTETIRPFGKARLDVGREADFWSHSEQLP